MREIFSNAAGHSPAQERLNALVLSTFATVLGAIGVMSGLFSWLSAAQDAETQVAFVLRIFAPLVTGITLLGAALAAHYWKRLGLAFAMVMAITCAFALAFPLGLKVGIHAQSLTMLALGILLSGLIYGPREAKCVMLGAVATVCFLYAAELFHWFGITTPQQTVTAPVMRFANFVALYIGTGWLVAKYGELYHRTLQDQQETLATLHATVAEMVQTRSERERQASVLRTVTDAIPGTIGYWNRHLICEFANHGYADYLGMDPTAMVGRRYEDVMSPDIVAHNLPYIRRTLAGESISFASNGRDLQGKSWSGWVRFIPDFTDGQVQGFFAIGWDVTELHQIQERLEQTNRQLQERTAQAEAANVAKSQFLATMSHEIRTPLNGIMGMAQLLLMPGLSESERVDYSRTVLTSGQTLLTLLNDILDLSKIEAGKMQLMHVTVDPVVVLMETLSLFSANAEEKGLQLDGKWHGKETVHYLGDPVRLRQMLSNLVSNAIKFTPLGSIHVDVTPLDEQSANSADTVVLEFSVRDSGPGIAKEKLDQLFQPFSQLDGSNTRRFGGTGLGLSIVRSLAEQMNGTVGVESEPNKGSRFWFTVRLDQAAASAERRNQLRHGINTLTSDAGTRKISVLLVEDNAVNQKVLQALLTRAGCITVWAANGQEALDALGIESGTGIRPDIILMDCQMPVMDGPDATRRIRAWEAQAGLMRLPIIAVTASAFAEDRERALDAGMDEFLTKPVDYDELVATLARHVKTKP